VPDLTGYITEGQIVLSREAHARGVYPPVDPLGSLSRLMRNGAGAGHTREGHIEVAAQLLAALAKARDVGELAELVGSEGLSATDQLYLQFEERLEADLVNQGRSERRSLDDTLERCWRVVSVLPRRELGMLPAELLQRYAVDSR
jgi:V/A-type H+-transporting ATPase subunit B